MGERAEGPPAGVVGNVVGHAHAARRRGEVVLMVPEPVGAGALFIDEKFPFPDLGDLREPAGLNPRQDSHAVLYDLARVHPRRDISQDAKAQVRRGEQVEVAGRGEEFPDRGRIAGYELFAVQMEDHSDDSRGADARMPGSES